MSVRWFCHGRFVQNEALGVNSTKKLTHVRVAVHRRQCWDSNFLKVTSCSGAAIQRRNFATRCRFRVPTHSAGASPDFCCIQIKHQSMINQYSFNGRHVKTQAKNMYEVQQSKHNIRIKTIYLSLTFPAFVSWESSTDIVIIPLLLVGNRFSLSTGVAQNLP